MIVKNFMIILISFPFSVYGWGKDYSLSPAVEGELVRVAVKVPEGLVAEPMQVVYRSSLCTFTDRTASGEYYRRDGYKRIDMQPMRQAQTDIFEAKLAMDGGGACRWRLSNVTFGVKYENAASFGSGVTYGGGGGVVVIFDGNSSPHGGWNISVDGDLSIRRDYYPWLNERFLGGYSKTISLATNGHIYSMYRALHARHVYFEPVVHSGFLVTSIQPKVKQKDNRTIFYYPDGSQSPEPHTKPNFSKLQAIRLAAEAKSRE